MLQEEKTWTTGALAKATGLTVRTLQHYDNIGLLPTSGRTEGGRRYYTKRDVIRLTQITIYKSIGFSLSDIREKLSDDPTREELIRMFTLQAPVLLKKMDDLHMALAVLSTSIDLYKAQKEPPLEIMAELIRATEGSGINAWNEFPFEAAIGETLNEKGLDSLHGAMNFYHPMRELMVEAIALRCIDTPADHLSAQRLAKNWWEKVILYMTGDDPEVVDALIAVNDSRDNWPPADRRLFEMAEPFLEAALAVYMKNNNLHIPFGEEAQDD
jgi:DNA-binding transcriptional MerR regulator